MVDGIALSKSIVIFLYTFPFFSLVIILLLLEYVIFVALNSMFSTVKVTYLGIRSAHECVWLVKRKLIWLPWAYLTRGDLEPARGNLHACKFLRDLTNIQIRTVTAERVGFVLSELSDERVTNAQVRYLHINKHREKYAKPDFEQFISLEINYFVGTGCFCF